MEMLIDISEGTKEQIIALTNIGASFPPKLQERIVRAIINGTPLPKGHGVEWVDNKCSTCGKGIEDLIDSREWYENERPSYCPFCGKRFKESE